MQTRSVSFPVRLLSAAVAGGAIALSGAWLLGGFDSSKTVTVEQVSSGATAPAASVKTNGGNWISNVYKRYAGGVVQVTSTSVVRVPADPFFGNPFGLIALVD